MQFEQLITIIEQTSRGLQKKALTSVNQLLVIRNWLVGFYLVQFEQKGEDRAKYGEKLLETIAVELKKKKLKGLSKTNLKIFRQFYEIYPQIAQAVPEESIRSIGQPLADQFSAEKGQALPDQSKKNKEIQTAPLLLFQHFTFTHFTELIKIKDPLKRAFYEQQAIKGNWSSRELKRQIASLLLERTGLSKDKSALLEAVRNNQDNISVEETIRDPYVLEFTGFKELPAYSESDLETALLDKLQDFLLELGHGFCFEARQKRITIGNEHDLVDLVFYNRILKCHVLIDLKVRTFSHADVGQMNYYLNYYKENIMHATDNPPVGIILCTDKHEIKVEYATAGLDNHLFVSKYLVELPSAEELKKLLYSEIG
jgi:predicted nuclease of restriction endonuclease-like (RecB) superfamily